MPSARAHQRYACGHTQVKNVPHRILTYNRLPPDFAKCGGSFSLGDRYNVERVFFLVKEGFVL
jgi:hypothetical protein